MCGSCGRKKKKAAPVVGAAFFFLRWLSGSGYG
jgi:hypothetical protein